MKKLKRDPIKYIRDRAKSKYEKGTECHICGAPETRPTMRPLFRLNIRRVGAT